jgi:hypothetical protein
LVNAQRQPFRHLQIAFFFFNLTLTEKIIRRSYVRKEN